MKATFSPITQWIFDLDNTLYPSHCNLFVQMDKRITQYVMRVTGKEFDAAYREQKIYYRDHGTTLRGLMNVHGIDPHDYLNDVHDIDYSSIPPNPQLGDLLEKLPGRKLIFTNGDVAHAKRTLAALQIEEAFDEIFDIAHADFVPKPERAPYDMFLQRHKVDPKRAVMFEDMARNLEVPKEMGMATVLLVPQENEKSPRQDWEHHGRDGQHIDFVSDDINAFITRIVDVL